jgi:carbon storage regulator
VDISGRNRSIKEERTMLVLSRKSGEALVIGDNVKVYVSRILGNRVTLAIEAPQDVHVIRGELEVSLRELTGKEGESGHPRDVSVATV